MNSLVFFLILMTVVPCLLSGLIVFRRWHNGWVLVSLLAFTLGAMIYIGFNAPWFLFSYWLLLLLLLVTGFGLIVGLKKLTGSSWKRPSAVGLLMTGLLAIGTLYFAKFTLSVLPAIGKPAETVELAFPLKDGVYAVTQGGAGVPLQTGHAGTPAQQYALDIVKLNAFGVTSADYLSDYTLQDYSLGEPVYSPCNGRVVWVRDGLPNEPDMKSKTPAGNAVAIECQGVSIGFGHFEPGSIPVIQGDLVVTGELIGRIGLSGRTQGPHLHFHAERGSWQGDVSDNVGAAMTFNGRFLWTGRLVDQRE